MANQNALPTDKGPGVLDQPPFYASSLDHILAELTRIDARIQSQVSRLRRGELPDQEFSGLFVSDEEVDALLGRPLDVDMNGVGAAAASELLNLEMEIGERKAASLARGIVLRLAVLQSAFGLTPFDVDVLLVCLAPELDVRYERLYAYVQDDATKRRPSVDLVLGLLCDSFRGRIAARERFSSTAPLVRQHLVSLVDDPAGPAPTLLGRVVRADDRVVGYLLGSDTVDPRIRHHAQVVRSENRDGVRRVPAGIMDRLDRLERLEKTRQCYEAERIFYFHGPRGTGKRAAAEELCHRSGRPLLAVNSDALLNDPEIDFRLAVDLVCREARLQDAGLYWSGFDRLLGDDMSLRFDALIAMIEAREGLSVLAGDAIWQPAGRLRGRRFHRVEFPRPDLGQRLSAWRTTLTGMPHAPNLDLKALAQQFRLTGGEIEDAVHTGRNLACWRDPENAEINTEDLRAAARLHSNRKLGTLAQKITPRYTWNDIVLPPRRFQHLQEIFDAAKFSAIVYGDWGFGDKLSLGKGLSVLFSGPSGTGKTMAAEILARELGLDLYKIDLSNVVSKYIGETEKNLSRVFAEAETANAILFFDEADALFGKRSEVRDAHDRHANIETGYLLQRMEEYEGLVILATNLSKNMDEAFMRRLHFTVEFPFPDAGGRRRIWEGVWPGNTPRTADLDLDFMASRYELTGGSIKNAALAAAFMAAADGGTVDLRHLLRATQREYQKMGKVVGEGDFARPVTTEKTQ